MIVDLIPKKYKIIDFYRESIDDFTLTVDYKEKFMPGQFFQVSLLGIGEAPISVANYGDDYLKLNIRQVGKLTNSLAKLQKGDYLFLRGPYGNGFPMHFFENNTLIMIGGGCGVAPLLGVIDYYLKNIKSFKGLEAFFGFRDPENILFKRETNKSPDSIKIHLSVDKLSKNSCFTGNVGFVTKLLEKTPLDNFQKIVVICGPPMMMKSCVEILKQKGFNEDQIFVSFERLMYCAKGACCHCMIQEKLTCIDGPVFRYDDIKEKKDE